MSEPTWCRSLVVEPGRHTLTQPELAERLRTQLGSLPDSRRLRQLVGFVYDRSTVRQRHVEAGLDEVELAREGWHRTVNEATRALGQRTLERLAAVDDGLGEASAFVVVSSSFAGFPSLSRRLQEPAGLPLDAHCYDLTGLGCAGPTQGLAFAQSLLEQGHRTVCLLFVDVMATHGMCRRWTALPEVNEVVAHCLASDGAAALLLSRDPGDDPRLGFGSVALHTRLWPDSLDQNDLCASADGEPYLSVGKDIRTRLLEEAGRALPAEVRAAPLLLHPGGIALMEQLGGTFPELADTVALSTALLQDHGNIGSASVLWVLDQALRRGTPLGPFFHLFALGPGIVTTRLRVDGVLQPGVAHA